MSVLVCVCVCVCAHRLASSSLCPQVVKNFNTSGVDLADICTSRLNDETEGGVYGV